jgi:hypothetical protein
MDNRRAALALLVGAALVAALTVSVSHGFALEYGDTGAGWWRSALDGLRWWWGGAVVVAVLTFGALRLARGWRPARTAAVVLVLATLVGTAAGAAVGVEQKWGRYPSTPHCTFETTSGPAAPVVRAAEAAYRELDHPGPFSGGGSSGVDGCSSELMVRDGSDPRPAYRSTLAAHGWRLVADQAHVLRAVKGDQGFELSSDGGGWTVWIGPAHLEDRPLDEGEVGPRS